MEGRRGLLEDREGVGGLYIGGVEEGRVEVLEAVGEDGGRISGIGDISRPSKKNNRLKKYLSSLFSLPFCSFLDFFSHQFLPDPLL